MVQQMGYNKSTIITDTKTDDLLQKLAIIKLALAEVKAGAILAPQVWGLPPAPHSP